MKRLLSAIALAAATAVPALAADVHVSGGIGQGGLYGRIDIGHFPQPQVIYREPIVIRPAPVSAIRQPIYLHVPPGHAKHWDKHCGKYNACGQPVYFVEESWYNNVYAPRYHASRGRDRDEASHDRRKRDPHGRGHGKGRGRGHGDD